MEERKALILVSDGEDSGPDAKGSVSTREQTLEGARLFRGRDLHGGLHGVSPEGGGRLNRDFLDAVAEQSGGRSYYPDEIEDLSRHFRQIQYELHRQYQIAYLPARNRKEGGWRSIEVRIKGRDDLVARTRKGYYAAPDLERTGRGRSRERRPRLPVGIVQDSIADREEARGRLGTPTSGRHRAGARNQRR